MEKRTKGKYEKEDKEGRKKKRKYRRKRKRRRVLKCKGGVHGRKLTAR